MEASMASINPLLSQNSSIKPWVDQISKTLKTQLSVTIDPLPVSIYEIPMTLRAEKLEAYTPQRIGLGLKHHFQPELYLMEQNKLNAVKILLKPRQIIDCQQEIVERVKEIVPLIRACYDTYLDFDDHTLAWLFAIDGLFMLDQLGVYSSNQNAREAKDLIMLENQISLIVLKEIQKALSGENAHEQEDYLESRFRFFCESHSPFLLTKEKINFSRANHLLDYMYHSIVNNKTSLSRQVNFSKPGSNDHLAEKDAMLELLEAVIKIGGLIPGAQPFLLIVEFVKKMLPESTKEKVISEEIKVPSVSELHNIDGIKFLLSPRNGGIRNVYFLLEKERACYLPRITLDDNSEVMLRNLVAYEKLMAKYSLAAGYGLELTEYVDFMCGIIDTVKDVRLLQEEKIIEGNLGDEEIVKMFNGISRYHGSMSVASELRKTVNELNKVYESMPRIWVKRLVEKQLRASTKIITSLIGVSSMLILFRELYVKAFGSFTSDKMETFSSSIDLKRMHMVSTCS